MSGYCFLFILNVSKMETPGLHSLLQNLQYITALDNVQYVRLCPNIHTTFAYLHNKKSTSLP